MNEAYLFAKLLHIVSASILFGTGIGTAFFMLRAHLSGNQAAMAVTTRHVVHADWIFTTPAIIVQLLTGIWLTLQLSIPLDSAWFIAVMALFVLVGACWVPVVVLQIRIRNAIADGASVSAYRPLMKIWVALGVPAFLAVIALYFLMVFKPGLGA